MADAYRRGRRRRTVASTVVLLVVLGLVVAVAVVAVVSGPSREDGGSSGRELEPVAVELSETASKVPWYAAGKLHLPGAVLDVRGLRDVASVDSGAVYTDAQGDLMWVDPLGRRSLLGSIGQGGTFVAADEGDLVAWLTEAADAQLMVHDLATGSDVVRVDVEGPGTVIAIDDGSAFFHDERGDLELSLATGEVETTGTSSLLDVASKTRVFQQLPGRIHALPAFLDTQFSWAGDGAQLSAGGGFVLTWVGDDLAIYDTRIGETVPTDLHPLERALDAEFGPDETITYVVLDPSQSSGRVVIRTCSLGLHHHASGRDPGCVDEEAGTYRGLDDDFLLAR